MILRKLAIILLLLLSPLAVMAQEPIPAAHHHWPAGIAISLGSQFKQTFYTDCKAHPFAHCLPMALRWGAAMADTATSCYGAVTSYYEGGPAHYIVGRHPSCTQLTALSVSAMTINSMSVNWLAHSFKASCDREASNPDSRWWKTPSHTKSTSGCYWGVEWAATIAQTAYESPIVKNNVSLLEQK